MSYCDFSIGQLSGNLLENTISYFHFVSPCYISGVRIGYRRITSSLFYHCATGAHSGFPIFTEFFKISSNTSTYIRFLFLCKQSVLGKLLVYETLSWENNMIKVCIHWTNYEILTIIILASLSYYKAVGIYKDIFYS